MCVIFLYATSNPCPGGYKLILASNRDEFYVRPTRPAGKWPDAAHVYGGIDLEPGREGGTWLAVSGLDGVFKVGALLNLTGEPATKDAVGRGMIVTDFVKSYEAEHDIKKYNKTLVDDCLKYSAFNFVSIQIGERFKPVEITTCCSAPPLLFQYDNGTCYGFGNSLPNEPFEKVRHGNKVFQEIVKKFHMNNQKINMVEETRAELIEDLKELLKCRKKCWPDADLKRRAPKWGEYMSALNVCVPDVGYGSRTHSVILIDEHDKMYFVEETMADTDPAGKWIETVIEKQFFKDH